MLPSWSGLLTIFCALLAFLRAAAQRSEQAEAVAKNDSIPVVFEETFEATPRTRRVQKLKPKCGKYFLSNVMNGIWIKKLPPISIDKWKRRKLVLEMWEEERKLDKIMRAVWKSRGIPDNPWGSTTRCGFSRERKLTNRKWSLGIGTWCDPKGPKPCCTDLMNGGCVAAQQGMCNCPSCADVRTLQHAELMEWMPYSHWCLWHKYSPSEACDVVENSPVKELYFVGDSFLQSMYLTLLMILTGKPFRGSWKKEPLNGQERARCSNYGMTYYKDCRAMTQSLDDMLYKDALCGDGRNVTFKAEFRKYYSTKFKEEFKQFVSELLGKQGTYVIVGVGFHVQMELELAINEFLNPAVWMVKNYYKDKPEVPLNQRWPQFLFSQPMDYGLLKMSRHVKVHHSTRQQAFEQGMRRYCNQNSIPVLDFTRLTKGVHSFDGVHYGVAVNMAKSQIFLNYLATLPTD